MWNTNNGEMLGLVLDDPIYAYESRYEQLYDKSNASFIVHPFYPNPTDAKATLEYTLRKDDIAVLRIADVLGREIGKYILYTSVNKFELNTNEIADGIYQYSISVNGVMALTNKLVIIKP